MFEKTKINEKEAEDGPFLKKPSELPKMKLKLLADLGSGLALLVEQLPLTLRFKSSHQQKLFTINCIKTVLKRRK